MHETRKISTIAIMYEDGPEVLRFRIGDPVRSRVSSGVAPPLTIIAVQVSAAGIEYRCEWTAAWDGRVNRCWIHDFWLEPVTSGQIPDTGDQISGESNLGALGWSPQFRTGDLPAAWRALAAQRRNYPNIQHRLVRHTNGYVTPIPDDTQALLQADQDWLIDHPLNTPDPAPPAPRKASDTSKEV